MSLTTHSFHAPLNYFHAPSRTHARHTAFYLCPSQFCTPLHSLPQRSVPVNVQTFTPRVNLNPEHRSNPDRSLALTTQARASRARYPRSVSLEELPLYALITHVHAGRVPPSDFPTATCLPLLRAHPHTSSVDAFPTRIQSFGHRAPGWALRMGPSHHPGKASYWTLDVRMGEGNKRDPKRQDPKGDQAWGYEDDYSEVPYAQPKRSRRTATCMQPVGRQRLCVTFSANSSTLIPGYMPLFRAEPCTIFLHL